MERAEIGIDGNCGFALLGENIQEGEAEFVEIQWRDESKSYLDEVVAAKKAFLKLQARLNKPEMSFFFGPSHPWGD